MNVIARLVTRLHQDDAQDLIEYALLVGLIVIVAIVGVGAVGSVVNNVLWRTVTNGLGNSI